MLVGEARSPCVKYHRGCGAVFIVAVARLKRLVTRIEPIDLGGGSSSLFQIRTLDFYSSSFSRWVCKMDVWGWREGEERREGKGEW